ncbi:putative F-box/kelch-repeat protein At3g20710 [Humulus lupulus]|uniref:putative F-box/kelch-repeat protein At3g20710 n=1 Tax=Humulus lupulus TaxID=3486 RepID=UPI002B406A5B|nr:putative F-box/kelch-repeat protein At3g20710 [Humulus lupulus]
MAGSSTVVCPYLPKEIVEKILLMLPHESIITFKRVCKLWYNITKNESFISDHINRHSKSNATTSLLLFHHLNDSLYTISYDHDQDHDNRNDYLIPCVVEQSLPTSDLLHSIERLYFLRNQARGLHCNGIIAFPKNDDSKIIFFNPTLKQFKILHTQFRPEFVSIGHGFGYDRRTDLYKYVDICQSNYNGATIFKARVCTLWISNSGGVSSRWREIDMVNPSQNKFDNIGVYLKSVCYWLNLHEQCLVSFDMCDEKFGMIPLPCDTKFSTTCQAKLTIWKGESLVLLFMRKPFGSKFLLNCEMWMMVEENDNTYWRRHLTIGPIKEYEFLRCLHFWNHEELLMEGRDVASRYEFLMSYNIRTKKIRRLNFSLIGLHFSTLYSKSLVSLSNN